MNKNFNNQNGKGTQRGQMQNQGNRQSDTPPSGGGTNPEREREPGRMESWNKQNTDRERETPSAEHGTQMNRERESNRVESWSKQNPEREKEIHPVEPSPERNLGREKDRLESSAERNPTMGKEANVVDSGTIKDREPVEGSSSSRAQAKSDHEPLYKTRTFQENTQNRNQGSTLDELKNPATMGASLYVIAALLLIGWAVGFFYYNAGPAIHSLLVLALVSILIKVAQGRNY